MKFFRDYKKTIFLIALAAMIFLPSIKTVQAANVGDIINFNVDKNYDATGRSQVLATLIKSTSGLYFYIEKSWWDAQSTARQNEILASLDGLSNEFTNKIYPTLTSVYGFEARPGIDGDSKIAVFFESLNNNLGGYVRTSDEYSKLQAPDSNEKEMLYLPIAQITDSKLKVFLAHEFVHLIVFNQKNIIQGVDEEIWLSEARSDYASTILGYDDIYEGSNLQRRVEDFLSQPSDSLTEWQGTKYDYAVENLFMHYLISHYGINILTDSLHSKLVGIDSLNEALSRNGFKENFSQIFTNWTLALAINNCNYNPNYCYNGQNLNNLRINPTLIFLPLTGDSSLSMSNSTKNWSGNWQKIIGGNGNLTLDFSSFTGLNFQVPYIVYDKNNNYTVNFLQLDKNEKGEITIKDFGTKYNSLIIIPSLQTKTFGFDGTELSYPYTLTVSIKGNTLSEDPMLVQIQKLLDQIDALKKQIAAIQSGNPVPANNSACSALNNNLYFGMSNNSQVSCLQQFLKSQGMDIYPEGLVTGNFGSLTKLAVIRFQEKYRSEILTPVNLSSGTGFVGLLTRVKINQLLQTSH